jgi:hypothetical protein
MHWEPCLATNLLPAGLLVVHDAGRGGQNDLAELNSERGIDRKIQADLTEGICFFV